MILHHDKYTNLENFNLNKILVIVLNHSFQQIFEENPHSFPLNSF